MKVKLKKFFKDNPGAIFILAFQVLLLVFAFLIVNDSMEKYDFLNGLAISFLILGVFLQAVSFLARKCNKRLETCEDLKELGNECLNAYLKSLKFHLYILYGGLVMC